MFEKKFVYFLLENDINKDLIIARDKREFQKFKDLIKECKLFNTKTLMPYEEVRVQTTNDKIALMFKFTINRNTSLRSKSCIDKNDKKTMTRFNCSYCKISTFELCAFNAVYKTNGMIIKKGNNKHG